MNAELHLAAVSATGAAASIPLQDDPATLASLARRAARRDRGAWNELVARFNPRLEAAAHGFRLSAADVDDVVQTTWLAALTQLEWIEKPDAVGAWLLVTARRAALSILQGSLREVLTDEPPPSRDPAPDSPAAAVVAPLEDAA